MISCYHNRLFNHAGARACCGSCVCGTARTMTQSPLLPPPHLHFLQMSPSNKVGREELKGSQTSCWHLPLPPPLPPHHPPPLPSGQSLFFAFFSSSLASAHPSASPFLPLYCQGTSLETTRVSPYFFLQRHKEGRHSFNHPLLPPHLASTLLLGGQTNKSCHADSCRLWVIITDNYPPPGGVIGRWGWRVRTVRSSHIFPRKRYFAVNRHHLWNDCACVTSSKWQPFSRGYGPVRPAESISTLNLWPPALINT